MRSIVRLASAAALSCSAATGLQAAPGDALSGPAPAWQAIDSPRLLASTCQRNLAQANAALKALRRHPADSQWLRAQDRFMARVEDWAYRLVFMAHVHPDKAVRTAAEACELKWNGFFSSLGQESALYRAARRLQPADETDRQLLTNLLRDFEDAGVSLPPAQRARAKQLNDRIAALGQQFDRNIRDANLRVPFSKADLRGVPEAVWKDAKPGPDGRLLLGVEAPTYGPVLQLAESAAARERMWRAKTDEGGTRNLALLAEITRLRKDYAQLFGAASWAEFVIRRRMAETPARAETFLAEVKTAVQARELRELEELRQAKAAHLGEPPAQVTLQRWDVPFYTERVRQARYAVDQEAFRQHFPPQESLQFVLRLVERLMGVRYQRLEGATAWHPEVQTYAVSDAATGAPLGSLWVDLYPREGKYNHAAVWGLRAVSTDLKRQPQAALVVNFDRKGLTLDEMETLLHELGHAVHNNLSTTRHVQQAGTNVLRDFVEAPSQMLEDWVYDRRALQLMAEVCPACKPVPDALLDQAVAARRFGKGVQQSRQHLYASYDLALYGPTPRDPMALWSQMEGATPLGHVAGSRFPAGFSHIAGGYSAGYYGYLWSEVVAADMRTAFAADKLDAQVGRRYRDAVLAQGSQRLPQQLVKDFLGRDFNARAFFDELAR